MDITVEMLNRLIGCRRFHERAPDWGERAWIAQGKDADVIYLDMGNSWCDIIHVIPKVENPEQWLKRFFHKAVTLDEDECG